MYIVPGKVVDNDIENYNKSESSFKPVVETERSIDHIGSEKTPIRYSTAVRNIGQ